MPRRTDNFRSAPPRQGQHAGFARAVGGVMLLLPTAVASAQRVPPPGDAPSLGGAGQWVQLLIALVVVIAVLLAAAWLLKKFAGRGGAASLSRGGRLDILAIRPVDNRAKLLVVRFGRRVVLVGTGPEGLTALSETADPAETAAWLSEGDCEPEEAEA